MNTPTLWSPEQLADHHVAAQAKNGPWVKARPLGWQGLELRRRFSLAWGVFTARYDALQWGAGQ